MSDMLKRDYQTWTTSTSSSTASAAIPSSPTPHAEDTMDAFGDDNDDLFASFDAQKDVDESSKLFYLNFCISDLSLELQSRGKSVAQFQIDGLKSSFTRRPFDSSTVFSLQSLHLIDTMPIHVADVSTSSERRYASSETSPRSPASPDPSFRPTSKKSILEDRTKVLVALTSMDSTVKSGEAAKVDILTIDRNCPKFAAGLLDSTHRFIDVNLCRLDILFSLQTWVIVFDFFGIGSGGIPPPTPMTDEPKKFPRRRGRSRRRPTQPSQEEPEPHQATTETEFFNSEVDIKVRSLSVVLNKPEYEVASASAINYVSKVHLKNGNFSVEGTLGDFTLKDLTPHGRLYRDRFLSRGEHVLKFHFFKYGAPDEKLQVLYTHLQFLIFGRVLGPLTHFAIDTTSRCCSFFIKLIRKLISYYIFLYLISQQSFECSND